MGGLFDDILKHGESLFIDEVSLDFDFVPRKLLHRENQHQYIADCIKPLFNNRSGRNLFIFGAPGIGKTAATKYVLRELEKEGAEVYPIYVNCWKKDTSYKIIVDICEQIGYKWVHNRRTDELLRAVAEIINRKSAVIVLDEVDKVKEIDILYSLSEDLVRKSILLVCNSENWFAGLDSRIKSRLNVDVINFKEYNLAETEDILKLRRDIAFVPGVWDADAFNVVVEKCFGAKDIRQGLFLMKESGGLAESKASKKVSKDFVDGAISKIEKFKIKNVEDFGIEEQKILSIIERFSGKPISEIYDVYSSEGGEKSYRTFHRKLEELSDNKMVYFEEKGKDKIVMYSKKLSDF